MVLKLMTIFFVEYVTGMWIMKFKLHTCMWKRTSWGDYQCELCYEFRHVLEHSKGEEE